MPIDDFQTKSQLSLTYPPDLRNAIAQAASYWQEFCALPLSIKQKMPYSNDAVGVGYEYKDGRVYKGDHKENFDISLGGQHWLSNQVVAVGNPAVEKFVHATSRAISIIKPIILDFAVDAERSFGLSGLLDEIDDASFFIRFIHYFGDRDLAEETATPHIDQCGFTLHLFESDPGLESLSFQKQWQPMPVSSGETVIIPGLQMQLRSNNNIKALCHRVVANKKTAEQGRFSAVCFVMLNKTPGYDKQRLGRLQERGSGFNYEMSLDEVRELFKV